MKKLLITILLSSISITTLAIVVETPSNHFRYNIPQPDKITNGDFDGDGILDVVDSDTDNDGSDNDDDPFPFNPNRGGSSIVENSDNDSWPYIGDTCEDDGLLLQETVNELNAWSGLNYTVSTWCSTTTLNLSNQGLTLIPASIGGLTNLTILYVDNNAISSVPQSIGNLTDLFFLVMNHNNIANLPVSFDELVNLNFLYLHDNPGSPFNDVSCAGMASCVK